MTTTTRKQKARTVRYDALVGTLALTVSGKDAGTFWLDRLDAPAGCVAVRLTKFVACRRGEGDEAYDVSVDRNAEGRDERLCSCKGFNSHGHCKHSDALAALVAAGKLS